MWKYQWVTSATLVLLARMDQYTLALFSYFAIVKEHVHLKNTQLLSN